MTRNFSESEKSVLNSLNSQIQNLKEQSRTAILWLQYIDYITLLKQYIVAKITSNWFLHIQTMKSMLNLFAASGHIHYARSTRIGREEGYKPMAARKVCERFSCTKKI